VLPDTDDVSCFAAGSVLFTTGSPVRALTVAHSRSYRGSGLVLAFEGVETRSEAELLRGTTVSIPADRRRPLASDEFWPEDLIGLIAVDSGGEVLGEVTGVEFGGQDRLVVTTQDGSEVLVPFVADLVGDPEGGRITIAPPPGLFEPR